MSEPILLNVCEVFSPNEAAAEAARKSWNVRSITLDLMYDNIPGLRQAELDTKNYIYDQLVRIVDRFY